MVSYSQIFWALSFGWLVGPPVCHNFLKGQESTNLFNLESDIKRNHFYVKNIHTIISIPIHTLKYKCGHSKLCQSTRM